MPPTQIMKKKKEKKVCNTRWLQCKASTQCLILFFYDLISKQQHNDTKFSFMDS